ncbi:hypothetical protein ACFW96_13475 [Streptomyces gardneri]|uniref:hypothetical protein n=1 Tax=Streptomyces gardneri TaxID=66892 RepID=UPI0036A45279
MATGPTPAVSEFRRVFAQPVRPRTGRTKPRAETTNRWYAYSRSANPHSRPLSRAAGLPTTSARPSSGGRTVMVPPCSRTAQGVAEELLLWLVEDVTRQHEAEDGLYGQVRKLAALADERAAFAGRTLHELRTPLATVLSFAELLLDPVSGPLNPEPEVGCARGWAPSPTGARRRRSTRPSRRW